MFRRKKVSIDPDEHEDMIPTDERKFNSTVALYEINKHLANAKKK